MAALKQLDQLSVKELRKELRYRYVIIGGTKDTARLRQALIDQIKDPDTYLFEIKPEIYELIGKIQEEIDAMHEQINRMGSKVDESVLEGQTNQFDKVVTQANEGIDSLMKERLPVASVKELHGQDCGCTNSDDGDAGDWSAVCVCVVGKSCGCDFKDEKYDNHCCDSLNWVYRIKPKETNKV